MNGAKLVGIAERLLPRRGQLILMRLRSAAKSLRPIRFSFPTVPWPRTESFPPYPASSDNPLEQAGARHSPSKRKHNYLTYYWTHFRDIRFEVRNVLEIGVQTDRSVRMWEEFFPNATIHGIDLDARCKQFEGDRRKIYIGDQSDGDFLRSVIALVGKPLDIIIDDGSHRVEHQVKSFDILFPALADHGIYVVEDTGGIVGDYSLRTVTALKSIVDHVMYWPKNFDPKDWPYLSSFPDGATWIDRNVVGIAFYPWIVFIFRGRNPEDNPFLEPMPEDMR